MVVPEPADPPPCPGTVMLSHILAPVTVTPWGVFSSQSPRKVPPRAGATIGTVMSTVCPGAVVGINTLDGAPSWFPLPNLTE